MISVPRATYFPHRHNHDGSWDSICSECFRTIAKDKRETELPDFEKAHLCDGLDLGRVFYPGERR